MVDPDRVIIRSPTDDDVADMADVLALAHGWPPERRAGAEDVLRWKMRSHPLAPEHHLVAEADGRVVATYLKILRPVRVRGRACLARDGVDLAVHPDHQRRGIYSALTEHSFRHLDGRLDLAVSYAQHPAVERRRAQLGYRPLGNPIRVLMKVLDVGRFVRGKGGRLPAPLAGLRIRALSARARVASRGASRGRPRDWDLRVADAFDPRVDAFFEEAARPFDFIVEKGGPYLRWRYEEAPIGGFRIVLAERDDRLLGFAVVGRRGHRGFLADLLALPGRADVAGSLAEEGLRLLAAEGPDAVTCWVPARHPYQPVLRGLGFAPLGGVTGFMWRPLAMGEAELAFLEDPAAAIHMVLGDSDLV